MVAVRGLPITIYGIAFAALVFGLMMTVITLIWINTLQELVPSHLLGAVSSV